MTTGSIEVNAKIERMVEQLRKHQQKLTQTQGFDLVSSQNFNQETLNTHLSDETDSINIETYLKSHMMIDKHPSGSPIKQ